MEEYFFTAAPCTFAVNIEGIPPSDVTLYMNAIPDNVELLSIRKETYIPPAESSMGYGTHVVIVVRFSKSGAYRLFAADLQVKEGYFKVPFEVVHVYENTQVLKPELSVRFDSPSFPKQREMRLSAGEHVLYTVYIKYAADVQDLAWNIPENSLFKELRRYPVLDADAPKMNFSLDEVPVASFDWQPLFTGTHRLPPVEIVATAYNGSRSIVDFPSYTLTVLQAAEVEEESEEKISAFPEAFAAPDKQQPLSNSVEISDEDIQRLLELHKKERLSLPFLSRATVMRQEAELGLGLPAGRAEPSVPLFVILVVLVCITGLLSVFLFVIHRFPLALLCVIALVLLGMGAIINGHNVRTDYALFTGGEVLPIPEKDLSRGFSLQRGSVVRIVKQTDSWLYIVFNDTYGWVLKENIILIR